MKLKTEMIKTNTGNYVPYMSIEARANHPNPMSHDMAAAHALMQAISEAESEDDEFPNTYAAHIRLRADELMREWGFGEAVE